jgi:hypothetical protein
VTQRDPGLLANFREKTARRLAFVYPGRLLPVSPLQLATFYAQEHTLRDYLQRQLERYSVSEDPGSWRAKCDDFPRSWPDALPSATS